MSEAPEKRRGEKVQLVHDNPPPVEGQDVMLLSGDTQLLQVSEYSYKVKKTHGERIYSMAFQVHKMATSGIYAMALGATLII